MKASVVLDYINRNEIEILKGMAKEEIFQESLKGNGDARKRYTAMKKYFTYCGNANMIATQYPKTGIEYMGEIYNSFVDGCSVVFTKESVGEIKTFDQYNEEHNKVANYLNVIPFFDTSCHVRLGEIDFNTAIAEAKTKGYKLTKKEALSNNFFFKIKDGFFRIALADYTFGVINNGDPMETFYLDWKSQLIVKNELGIAIILPTNVPDAVRNGDYTGVTVIEVDV